MKKILVLAIAALPMFAMAQDKKEATKDTNTEAKPSEKPVLNNPENVFMELVISQGPVGSIIKADVGREAISNLADKELVKQLGDLRSMSFSNMPDALTFLSGIGFKLQNSYIVYDKDGRAETHMIFEKRIVKKPQDGGAKPSRPERPAAEMKTPDGKGSTAPSDKKPQAKPAEKK